MYVNVNVRDNKRKNDLVQATEPQAKTSALPDSQGIMFDDTTDAPCTELFTAKPTKIRLSLKNPLRI